MPRFDGRLSRAKALVLMKRMGLHPSTLTGSARRRHSRYHMKTMDTIPDPVDYFKKALTIELEHGTANRKTNVTDDDLDATAKIVTAHLYGVEHGARPLKWKWFPAYYDSLMYSEKHVPL